MTVQLEGTQVMVHTPIENIRKYVTLSVKPMFTLKKDLLQIQIEITKTIESLKKIIFDKLGLKMAYYYNIRFYTTRPNLTELSVHSKTIFQSGLAEGSNIIAMAKHGFSFLPINE